MNKKGFTLIELLIVVAIIAILAAIAVPNFLEAQTRAKISRAKADIRTLATGLEAYQVDNNAYPIDGGKTPDGQAFWYVPGGPGAVYKAAGLSSPIAYLTTTQLIDPFRTKAAAEASRAADPDGVNFTEQDYRRFRYINYKYTYGAIQANVDNYMFPYGAYSLSSGGPDQSYTAEATAVPGHGSPTLMVVYDPTNGTVSRGDIVRSQKYPEQPGPHGPGF